MTRGWNGSQGQAGRTDPEEIIKMYLASDIKRDPVHWGYMAVGCCPSEFDNEKERVPRPGWAYRTVHKVITKHVGHPIKERKQFRFLSEMLPEKTQALTEKRLPAKHT